MVMKPILELEFILSKRVSIHPENILLVGLDLILAFFYIPNVRVSYGFWMIGEKRNYERIEILLKRPHKCLEGSVEYINC